MERPRRCPRKLTIRISISLFNCGFFWRACTIYVYSQYTEFSREHGNQRAYSTRLVMWCEWIVQNYLSMKQKPCKQDAHTRDTHTPGNNSLAINKRTERIDIEQRYLISGKLIRPQSHVVGIVSSRKTKSHNTSSHVCVQLLELIQYRNNNSAWLILFNRCMQNYICPYF